MVKLFMKIIMKIIMKINTRKYFSILNHYTFNRYQGSFGFPFTIERNSLSIEQEQHGDAFGGDTFELRINNQSF